MKIYFKRVFKYTLDNRTVQKVLPGEYETPRQVSKEVADLAISLGQAVLRPEPKVVPKKRKSRKKAPENKALGVK